MALVDLLEWHDAEHVRNQGLIGKSLVQQFMSANCPMAKASSWADVPGAVTLAMQKVHKLDGLPGKGPPRVLAIIDFNVPNSRDSLRLPHIASALANIFKCLGGEQCALLAHMPAYAKEDSGNDPLDEEVNIKNAFQRLVSPHNSGFACS